MHDDHVSRPRITTGTGADELVHRARLADVEWRLRADLQELRNRWTGYEWLLEEALAQEAEDGSTGPGVTTS